jgi:uncharacterized protein YegL
MFDVSGSMNEILEPAKEALIDYLKLEKKLKDSRFSLIIFSGHVRRLEYIRNGDQLYNEIKKIPAADGSTNMFDAFVCAKDNMNRMTSGIILLSDGYPTDITGYATENECDKIVNYAKKEIIPILKSNNGFGIGYMPLGGNKYIEFLNRLRDLI